MRPTSRSTETPPPQPLRLDWEPLSGWGRCPGGTYVYLEGQSEFDQALDRLLLRGRPVAIDFETNGLQPKTASIFLCALSQEPGRAWVFDPRGKDLSRFRALLSGLPLIAHNAIFEESFIREHYGVEPRIAFDTMLAQQLVTAGDRSRGAGLDDCARSYLGIELSKAERSLFPRMHPDSPVTNAQVAYVAGDVAVLLPLEAALRSELERHALTEVYERLELPLVPILARHVLEGVPVDRDRVLALREHLEAERAELEVALREVAPELVEIWSSNEKLKAYLVRQYGWKLESVDKPALEAALAGLDPGSPAARSVALVLGLRHADKMLSTYVTPLLYEGPHPAAGRIVPEREGGLLNPVTRRIHPSFKPCATETGRFACLRRGTRVLRARRPGCRSWIPIERIRRGDRVLGFDAQGQIVERRVLRRWSRDPRVIHRLHLVWFDDRRPYTTHLDLTDDHPIRLLDGSYRPAGELRPLQEVQGTDPRGRPRTYQVLWLENLGVSERVWDLEVEEVHNFVAEGIGVHNCSDPNLMNIPKDAAFRSLFRAEPGHLLVTSDYCVAEGTRVSTRRGLIPIEAVRVGDEVFQPGGASAAVSAVIDRGDLEVLRLRTALGYELLATALHRIQVLDDQGASVWRRLGELRPSDHVVIQPGRGAADQIRTIHLTPPCFDHPNAKRRSAPVCATEQLCIFLGYLTGDGCFGHEGVHWVVCDRDADLSEQLAQAARDLFGVSPSVSHYRGVFDWSFFSKPLQQWLIHLGLSKGSLPPFLWEVGDRMICAYLAGLFEADGSVQSGPCGRISLSSSRPLLIEEVQQLLLSQGIVSCRRHQKTGGGQFDCYEISIPAVWAERYQERIGFLSARKSAALAALVARGVRTKQGGMPLSPAHLSQLPRPLPRRLRKLLDNARYRGDRLSPRRARQLSEEFPEATATLGLHRLLEWGQCFDTVVSLEPVGVRRVYDLTVPGPTAYLSNGFISHNSQFEVRYLARMANETPMIEMFQAGYRAYVALESECRRLGVPRDGDGRVEFKAAEFAALSKPERAALTELNDALVATDFHSLTAQAVFGKRWEAADAAERKKLRGMAKTISFGIAYGATASLVAKRTDLSVEEAQQLIDDYYATYPRIAAFMRQCRNAVTGRGPLGPHGAGWTRSLAGRKRFYPLPARNTVSPRDYDRLLAAAQRQAQNHPIQCVAGSTRILEETRGCVPIERLAGQEVSIWDGERFVHARVESIGPKPLVRVQLQGGYQLECSPDHRLLTSNAKGLLRFRRPAEIQTQERVQLTQQAPEWRASVSDLPPLELSRTHNAGPLDLGVKDRIPEPCWQDSRRLAAYLRSLFDGDGTVNQEGAVLVSGRGRTHRAWAQEVQQALLLLGIRSRVRSDDGEPRQGSRTVVQVMKRDMDRFARRVGFLNPAKQRKAEAIAEGLRGPRYSACYGHGSPVTRIESTGLWVPMYDVVCSDSGRFAAAGIITHNSGNADVTKLATIEIDRAFREEFPEARMLLWVHDEIVVTAPAPQAAGVAARVRDEMVRAGEVWLGDVPVLVGQQIAECWTK